MKINLTRGELREAIQGLGRMVSARATLPILQCVRFDATQERVAVSGTDLEQFASFNPERRVERPGICIVELERLKPFTKGGEQDVLTLDSHDDQLTLANPVHGQSLQHVLPASDPNDWPTCPPDVNTSAAPVDFLAKFQTAMPFASTDASRVVLNSVFLDQSKKDTSKLVATDGRRMTVFESEPLPLAESCIVRICRFLEWNRLAGEVRIGMKKVNTFQWFKLEIGRWSYWAHAIEGTYPNWCQCVPSGDTASSFTLGEDDVALIKKALPTFPGPDNGTCDPIRLSGTGGKLYMQGKGREDKKWTSLELPAAKCTGKDVQIGVNRQYFREALDAGFRAFDIADGQSPLVSRDSKGGLHVLMPLRVDGDTPPQATAAPVPVPVPVPVAAQTAATVPPVTETQTKKKEKTMPEKTNPEPNALERLIAAYDAAKAKVREATEALIPMAGAIKEAIREDKQRRAEIDSVRAGLQKLQAIRV